MIILGGNCPNTMNSVSPWLTGSTAVGGRRRRTRRRQTRRRRHTRKYRR
jgi:hypothetical protein